MIIGFYPKLHSVLKVVKKSAIKHELGPTWFKLQMLTFKIWHIFYRISGIFWVKCQNFFHEIAQNMLEFH